MAAQNLKPAVKTRPNPRGGQTQPIQPITLHNRYQQTWHTIEFSNNRHIRIFSEQFRKNFFSVFLRCDVFILFHSCSLLQIRLFSRNSLNGMNPPSKKGSNFRSMHRMAENCFSISVGGLSPLSGGDSENNTRPSAAAQIGCRGACRW